MNDPLALLEQNITAEIAAQERMQRLLDRQLAILTKGKTAELSAVLADAERAVAESQGLEAERALLLQRIAALLGVPARELTLQKIEELAGSGSTALTTRGSELKAQLDRIRESNRRVQMLLRHSVHFIDDLVALVSGAATDSARARTYTRDGGLDRPAPGALTAEA
jgi:flagellar biosynthesis/type III secretory pathway chaperone